jgi:hypothetical protein
MVSAMTQSVNATEPNDWEQFARCADAIRPAAVIDIKVKGFKVKPIEGIMMRFDMSARRFIVTDTDGSTIASFEDDGKNVTIRGGWTSYISSELDTARVFRTKDPSCGVDQRTAVFKHPVMPAN